MKIGIGREGPSFNLLFSLLSHQRRKKRKRKIDHSPFIKRIIESLHFSVVLAFSLNLPLFKKFFKTSARNWKSEILSLSLFLSDLSYSFSRAATHLLFLSWYSKRIGKWFIHHYWSFYFHSLWNPHVAESSSPFSYFIEPDLSLFEVYSFFLMNKILDSYGFPLALQV